MSYSDFDLNLIKIFLTVAESGTLSAASKKLFISQPAITNSIKKLETYLNGSLFVRTSRGVKITPEGQQFYNYCKKSLDNLEEGFLVFAEFADLKAGEIRLGSSSTIIRNMLIPFLASFSEKYPNVKIAITDGLSTDLTKYLLKGDIDLAIMSMPIDNDKLFDTIKINSTTDCFIAGEKYANLKGVTLNKNELKNYPLILQKKPSNNRDYFEDMCHKNELYLTAKLETSSFWLINDFVASGMGIGYTIKDFIDRDLSSGRVFELKTNFKILPRDVVVATLSGGIKSYACNVFISEMQKYFKKA